MQARIAALLHRHAALERCLGEETRRPQADDLEVMRIKMTKLNIKDQLDALVREQRIRDRRHSREERRT